MEVAQYIYYLHCMYTRKGEKRKRNWSINSQIRDRDIEISPSRCSNSQFLFNIVSALCSSVLSQPDCDKSILSLIHLAGPGYKSLAPEGALHIQRAWKNKNLIGNFAMGTLWLAFDPSLPSQQHLFRGAEEQEVSVCVSEWVLQQADVERVHLM